MTLAKIMDINYGMGGAVGHLGADDLNLILALINSSRLLFG